MIKKSIIHLFWFLNGLLGLALGIIFLFLSADQLVGLVVFVTSWIVFNQLLILNNSSQAT